MTTNWASTHRLSSRVTLSEGLIIQGEVHLQPAVASHGGPETPIDLLNRGEPFFVMSLSRGEVVFVSKEQVAVLAHSKVVTFDDPERKVAARTIPLEIMMVGGAEHRGIAMSELPPTRARALDFLNAADRFFELMTDEGTLCINRRYVRAVRPLST